MWIIQEVPKYKKTFGCTRYIKTSFTRVLHIAQRDGLYVNSKTSLKHKDVTERAMCGWSTWTCSKTCFTVALDSGFGSELPSRIIHNIPIV